MVIFREDSEAERAGACIASARERLRARPEFKFSKARRDLRDAFFESVRDCDFTVRALVVDKSKVYSEHLRSQTESFYHYFIQLLLRNDNDCLERAKVKIDGCGNREFMRELDAYLRRQIPRNKVASVRMLDSRSDNLLQLADMCAGAVMKARRTDDKRNARRLDMLRRAGRVEDIWQFK